MGRSGCTISRVVHAEHDRADRGGGRSEAPTPALDLEPSGPQRKSGAGDDHQRGGTAHGIGHTRLGTVLMRPPHLGAPAPGRQVGRELGLPTGALMSARGPGQLQQPGNEGPKAPAGF